MTSNDRGRADTTKLNHQVVKNFTSVARLGNGPALSYIV